MSQVHVIFVTPAARSELGGQRCTVSKRAVRLTAALAM
jgi:hypothetical protein